MITLEDLDRARLARESIRESTDMLNRIRSSSGLKSPELDGMPRSSGPSDHTGHMAVIIADLEETIKRQESAFETAWEICEPFVSSIGNVITRTCFRYRFQYAMTYKEIASIMGIEHTENSVRSRIYREIKNQKRE